MALFLSKIRKRPQSLKLLGSMIASGPFKIAPGYFCFATKSPGTWGKADKDLAKKVGGKWLN